MIFTTHVFIAMQITTHGVGARGLHPDDLHVGPQPEVLLGLNRNERERGAPRSAARPSPLSRT